MVVVWGSVEALIRGLWADSGLCGCAESSASFLRLPSFRRCIRRVYIVLWLYWVRRGWERAGGADWGGIKGFGNSEAVNAAVVVVVAVVVATTRRREEERKRRRRGVVNPRRAKLALDSNEFATHSSLTLRSFVLRGMCRLARW